MWAMHNMGSVIDAADVFLTDSEAEAFVEMLGECELADISSKPGL